MSQNAKQPWIALAYGLWALANLETATADWPTYRGDARRSGYTASELPAKLSLRWTYKARHAPQPAWSGRDTRMPFDRAYHTVIADGRLYFGSSVDCKVYALNAATGAELWTFVTDAPVRFAPAVWEDRVFVVSDDGHLYCLAARDGGLRWRLRGGPTDSMLLGNGRMVSRWPARGGPVIVDDVVHFAAGMWPSEGIFLYAVDAETGRALWRNDTAGYRYMPQPHGGANARSGVSAQGYLAASGSRLLVPTGRGVPAAFKRASGDFLYFHLQRYGKAGGAGVLATDSIFVNGGLIFDAEHGNAVGAIPRTTVVTPKHLISAAGDKISGLERSQMWTESDAFDRRGNKTTRKALNKPAWAITAPHKVDSMIACGGSLVIGIDGSVSVIDLATQQTAFTTEVDGIPYGLAVDGGCLYVSTDAGVIYCFSGGPAQEPALIRAEQTGSVHAEDKVFALAAEEIIRRTGITEGYCLDLGCGDGSLAYALAKRTKLYIYAVDDDPRHVASARRTLDAAGLYGSRVTVHQRSLRHTGYPDYFADLVVSGRSVRGTAAPASSAEMSRLLRPNGGTTCIGRPGEMRKTVRAALDGAGTWTHQYADPANTVCSNDSLLKGPLGMLWFTDHGVQVPNRHGRGPAPLFSNGRLFHEGVNALLCVDAYNGRALWKYSLPSVLRAYDQEHLVGAAATGSNFCVSSSGVYVRVGSKCLKLDPARGRLLAEFEAPPKADGSTGAWAYIATAYGLLFGSLTCSEHVVRWAFGASDMSQLLTESQTLFALDDETGKLKWRYDAEHSIRHNAIAIGRGNIYLIDHPLARADTVVHRVAKPREMVQMDYPEDPSEALADVGGGLDDPDLDDEEDLPAEEAKPEEPAPPPPPPPMLLALRAADGKAVWKRTDGVAGTMLALSEKHDVLLAAWQSTRFRLPSEVGGRLTAFRASDGEPLWDTEAKYYSRPLLNDRTIYAQPGAWDLLTGEQRDYQFGRSYGCGILAGSKHLMVFRSATLGYTDLAASCGTENYGGIRPGCWINALPAGGLVLVPDATDRCTCSYLIKASIALKPYGHRAPTIVPGGGASPTPIQVQLASKGDDVRLHYTLDDTAPTRDSPRYSGPIRIAKTATLKSRAFHGRFPPSQISEAFFLIDPQVVSLDDPAWSIHDAPGDPRVRSKWQVRDGVATELQGFARGNTRTTDPAAERPGTLRVYTPPKPLTDGDLCLEIASSGYDTLGVAFRVQDVNHYYLWAMDLRRRCHTLALKDGTAYRMLAKNDRTYDRSRWHRIRVSLRGSRMAVFVDGKQDLAAEDSTFPSGGFALYAWSCAGAKFRHVTWRNHNE